MLPSPLQAMSHSSLLPYAESQSFRCEVSGSEQKVSRASVTPQVLRTAAITSDSP